jgi:hypothetical protein
MKTKMLLFAGLPLLLLVLLCPVHSAAQTGSSFIVLIDGPKYNPVKNVYTGSFSVNDPSLVRNLIYTVEDADLGTVTIPDTEVNLGGFNSRPFQLDGAQLAPEHKYILKVKAVDWSDHYIQRSGENYSPNAGEQFMLASKEFVHKPPPVPTPEVKIDSVTPNYTANELELMLTVPGSIPVLKYDGFIVDDAGQRVGTIAEELYHGPTLLIPLPRAIQDASEEREYKVTLNLHTKDDQVAQAVYAVKLRPPVKPGLFQRIGAALAANPLIALTIVIVISVVAIALILFGKRRQNNHVPPLGRPPTENTMGAVAVVRRNQLTVRVVQSQATGRGLEKRVTSFPCVIGRDENCDICIKDSALSRKHLRIDFRDGHFFVTDLDSKNGTFINDVQLRSRAVTHISGTVSVRLGDRTILELED